MSVFQFSISFVAGLLATLSPCVLPVLPFVTGASLSKNKWGPVALAFGLLIAFVGTTLLLTISGEFFGLSESSLKRGAGVLLGASGLLFLIPRWQEGFTNVFSRWTNKVASKPQENDGSFTQEFISGLLLGVIWSPCSGPSLGVALGLATQAGGIFSAAALLLAFGLGAVIPVLLFAYGAKALAKKIRSQSNKIIWAKKGIGLLMLIFGVLIFTKVDKNLEAFVNHLLPESYIHFTTQY